MNCPSPIAEILLNILQTGILRMRAAAWAGNTDQVEAEADHVHNLPAILRDYSPDALKFYWEIERPGFLSKVPDVAAFEEPWKRLRLTMASEGMLLSVP
jgi:hypothetical protein